MKLSIFLFGPYADTLGASSVEVTVPDNMHPTANTVMACLAEQQPKLRAMLSSALLSVNCQFALPDHPVDEEDELAIFGRVGGG